MVSSYGCGAIILAANAKKKSLLEGALTVCQDAQRENIVPRLSGQSDDVDRLCLLALVGGCPELHGRTGSLSSSGSECDAVSAPCSPLKLAFDGGLMVSGLRNTMPHMNRQ